ncbi:hypothetical protein ACG7TL_009244 [Trametes sanguinea]
MRSLIAATVVNSGVVEFQGLDPDSWIDTASYASIALSDAITTGVLVFNLKRYRTGFRRTDVLLGRVTSFAIHTGLLMGVVNTLLLILTFFGKNLKTQAVFLIIGFPATKLYAISVLAALNSRSSLANVANRNNTDLEFISLSRIPDRTVEIRVAEPQVRGRSTEDVSVPTVRARSATVGSKAMVQHPALSLGDT